MLLIFSVNSHLHQLFIFYCMHQSSLHRLFNIEQMQLLEMTPEELRILELQSMYAKGLKFVKQKSSNRFQCRERGKKSQKMHLSSTSPCPLQSQTQGTSKSKALLFHSVFSTRKTCFLMNYHNSSNLSCNLVVCLVQNQVLSYTYPINFLISTYLRHTVMRKDRLQYSNSVAAIRTVPILRSNHIQERSYYLETLSIAKQLNVLFAVYLQTCNCLVHCFTGVF